MGSDLARGGMWPCVHWDHGSPESWKWHVANSNIRRISKEEPLMQKG